MVAAYHDRHQLVTDTPLSTPVKSVAQKIDAARARAALDAARTLTIPGQQADETRWAAPSIGRSL